MTTPAEQYSRETFERRMIHNISLEIHALVLNIYTELVAENDRLRMRIAELEAENTTLRKEYTR